MNTPRASRLPFVARLVFFVAFPFTLLGIVELGFIGFDTLTNGALSRLRSPDLQRGIRSWTEHHAMRPGFSDVEPHVNSFGLRSPEVQVPKPSGTIRVLLLGDSFTFGYDVDDDQVFARRLESDLRSALGRPSLEVVNAGVISYCPLLEYLQYRHHLHILEADLVVLNFDMSDVRDHQTYAAQLVRSRDGTPLFVKEPSLGLRPSAMPKLLSFEWIERQTIAATARYRSWRGDPRFVGDRDRYTWTLDGGPNLENEARAAMAPIADLVRLLRHDRVPLVVATYPQAWQVAAEATPDPAVRLRVGVAPGTVHLNDRPFRLLERFTAEQGLAFVNTTEAFRHAPDPAGLYLRTDLHFSPRGHELYADELARYLVEHELRPAHAAGS